MSRQDFKTKFRKAHILSELIKMMRDKFLNLRQGSMSVSEYLDKFTSWGSYAHNGIDSDEKKKERFLNGLHEELQTYLVAMPYLTWKLWWMLPSWLRASARLPLRATRRG
jgi:hypothetical protein